MSMTCRLHSTRPTQVANHKHVHKANVTVALELFLKSVPQGYFPHCALVGYALMVRDPVDATSLSGFAMPYKLHPNGEAGGTSPSL